MINKVERKPHVLDKVERSPKVEVVEKRAGVVQSIVKTRRRVRQGTGAAARLRRRQVTTGKTWPVLNRIWPKSGRNSLG